MITTSKRATCITSAITSCASPSKRRTDCRSGRSPAPAISTLSFDGGASQPLGCFLMEGLRSPSPMPTESSWVLLPGGRPVRAPLCSRSRSGLAIGARHCGSRSGVLCVSDRLAIGARGPWRRMLPGGAVLAAPSGERGSGRGVWRSRLTSFRRVVDGRRSSRAIAARAARGCC
jgi:hypothetical protein